VRRPPAPNRRRRPALSRLDTLPRHHSGDVDVALVHPLRSIAFRTRSQGGRGWLGPYPVVESASGPAARGGVCKNCLLLAVDGECTRDMSMHQVGHCDVIVTSL
jgi:hypothetical protein